MGVAVVMVAVMIREGEEYGRLWVVSFSDVASPSSV